MDDKDEEDRIELLESDERSWREYLTEFKEKVYPLFEPYGFSIPQALQAWELNRLKNMLRELIDKT